MTLKPRILLTAKPVMARAGLVDETADRPLILAVHDFKLPCRRFVVEHKIAEVGKVSVTAEFLLRLVKNVGSLSEEDAATFFGYNRREMSHVLAEVEEADFVDRSEGRLTLTGTGHGLFGAGQETPAIYEVEQKSIKVGFDLISLAPQDRMPLSIFEVKLPELPVYDARRVAEAADQVPASFRRFYGELAMRTDPTTTSRRSLYSIDSVVAKERFSATVRVHVVATGLKPTLGEADLTDWRPEFELADREAITVAAARMIEGLTIQSRSDDQEAYALLIEMASEFLKDFTRRDGLSIERFYRYAYASHGDVRSDRPTVPLVGSLFTPENARRLIEIVGQGLKRTLKPAQAMFWVVPQTPVWGSTSILSEILDRTVSRIDATNQDLLSRRPVVSCALTTGKPERWVAEAFERSFTSEGRAMPGALELFLVPGAFVAALVHAPVGAQTGLAVPLGFASFDEKVVGRAAQLLRRFSNHFSLGGTLTSQLEQTVNIREAATVSDVGAAGG